MDGGSNGMTDDEDSCSYSVKIHKFPFDRYRAEVFDEDGWKVDIIQGNSREEIYEILRDEYPTMKWKE